MPVWVTFDPIDDYIGYCATKNKMRRLITHTVFKYIFYVNNLR